MATNGKSPKISESKSQQEAQATLKRFETLVEETETLADAFEKIAKKRGIAV